MSEGTNGQDNGGSDDIKQKVADAVPVATAEQLAERTRFKFREETLEIPEIGLSVILKSLSVRERESLPDPSDLSEVDDKGERTQRAIQSSAEVFAVIVAQPKVPVEQAVEFLPDWPA